MDSFFGPQYGDQSFQGVQRNDDQQDAMDFGDMSGHAGSMFGGQQHPQQMDHSHHARRQSQSARASMTSNDGLANGQNNQQGMHEFGGMMQGGSLDSFQFAPNSISQGMLMMPVGVVTQGSSNNNAGQKSNNSMSMMDQYMASNSQQYNGMDSSSSNFSTPTPSNQQMNMSMMASNIPQNYSGNMDVPHNNTKQNMVNNNNMAFMMQNSSAGMAQQNQYLNQMLMANMNHNLSQQNMQNSPSDRSMGNSVSPAQPNSVHQDMPAQLSAMSSHNSALNPSNGGSGASSARQHSFSGQSTNNSMQGNTIGNNGSTPSARQDQTMAMPRGYQGPWNTGLPHHPNAMIAPLTMPQNHQTSFVNAYSSTGFDMMQVLMRVATRPNPEINIGAVDLSCAFVVCDALEHDFPIVYCSENFERLTGYTKHEILGRNCRFLQAPDGKVQAGVQRHYVDDDTVLFLKNAITARRESQVSLINYRKGGQPFMNLLTMIPVSFDSNEVRFFVGFQVDLVEQPNSVTSKNPDGTYVVNYQRGLTMPRYVYSQPEQKPPDTDSGQTVSRDDVSQVLTTLGTGESDLTKRVWDKVLLENTDDVIYVLSLKGLFLYLSPSSKTTLEYEPSELVGTALSSVCHPSDIVPVTRELKDTLSGVPISVVYRIRRKHSGYMWFEGYGTLHTEQGKGRKSIVLVGRERPVYTVCKTELSASGGIAENEVWTKISTSGMLLFVSSNIRSMLDKQPDELVGTSIQALMRPESRSDFLRILEVSRTGRRASAKHELLNRRGQVLQAFSTVYPGDASEGSKPTFFVVQTRLLKFSRPPTGSVKTSIPKLERESSGRSLADSSSPMGSTGLQSSRRGSMSLSSPSKYMSTFEAVTTYAGQDGLPLGHQDIALASEQNLFDELKTTRSTSWQFELRQMEKRNRLLAEELQSLLAARKKRKRRKPAGSFEKECANCHTRQTPEWRRGPSGNRDLCNSCGLRWAKQQGRISPRTSSAKSAVSSSGSPPGTTTAVATAAASQNAHRRASSGKEGSAGESRSIDETLAEAAQNSEGGGTQQSRRSASGLSAASGDTSHVSKAQKTESGSPPSIPTKIEQD